MGNFTITEGFTQMKHIQMTTNPLKNSVCFLVVEQVVEKLGQLPNLLKDVGPIFSINIVM